MDCCINETSGRKEEERHINGSITMAKDALPLKTTGGEHLEDRGEVDDRSTTLPMPQHL